MAHDRFSEIIEEANRDGSLLKLEEFKLCEDGTVNTVTPVLAAPGVRGMLGLDEPRTPVMPTEVTEEGSVAAISETPAASESETVIPPAPVFTPAEQPVAREVYRAMQEISREVHNVPSVQALRKPEIQQRLVERVQARLPMTQPALLEDATASAPDVAAIVARTAELLVERTISIPRILVVPEGEAKRDFQSFTLDLSRVDFPPPSRALVVQHLNDNRQEWVYAASGGQIEDGSLEDLVVKGLLRNPEISYDENADTLYDLAEQVVEHFRAKGYEEEVVRDILVVHERPLAAQLFGQMEKHQNIGQVLYIHEIRQGFTELRSSTLNYSSGGLIRNPHARPPSSMRIESCVYEGFQKSLYPQVKFQSDGERVLGLILDRDSQKWFRPVRGQFLMTYRIGHQVSEYQPDFVAETENEILMLEVKAANEVGDVIVQEKARVAREWCQAASQHSQRLGGKPWRYVIIPHTQIATNQSLHYLINTAEA